MTVFTLAALGHGYVFYVCDNLGVIHSLTEVSSFIEWLLSKSSLDTTSSG